MSTRLMVLGLLNDTPRHGYEIQKWLEESRTAAWASVLPGSIYHALQQMQREGLVEVCAVPQTGHRLRAVYKITRSGRSEFKRLLLEALQRPPHAFPIDFYTALVFLEELPYREALHRIEALIPAIEQEIVAWDTSTQAIISSEKQSISEYTQTIFANGREHLEADLRLLRSLREMLVDGVR